MWGAAGGRSTSAGAPLPSPQLAAKTRPGALPSRARCSNLSVPRQFTPQGTSARFAGRPPPLSLLRRRRRHLFSSFHLHHISHSSSRSPSEQASKQALTLIRPIGLGVIYSVATTTYPPPTFHTLASTSRRPDRKRQSWLLTPNRSLPRSGSRQLLVTSSLRGRRRLSISYVGTPPCLLSALPPRLLHPASSSICFPVYT